MANLLRLSSFARQSASPATWLSPLSLRFFSAEAQKLRNIGISAHIDRCVFVWLWNGGSDKPSGGWMDGWIDGLVDWLIYREFPGSQRGRQDKWQCGAETQKGFREEISKKPIGVLPFERLSDIDLSSNCRVLPWHCHSSLCPFHRPLLASVVARRR